MSTPPNKESDVMTRAKRKPSLASSLSSINPINKMKTRAANAQAGGGSGSIPINNNNAGRVSSSPNNSVADSFDLNNAYLQVSKHQAGTNWGNISRHLSRSYEDIPERQEQEPSLTLNYTSNSFDDYIDFQKQEKELRRLEKETEAKKRAKQKEEEKRKKREEKEAKKERERGEKERRDAGEGEEEWERSEPSCEEKTRGQDKKKREKATPESVPRRQDDSADQTASVSKKQDAAEVAGSVDSVESKDSVRKKKVDTEPLSEPKEEIPHQKDRKESKKKKERDKDKGDYEDRSGSDKEREKRREMRKVSPSEERLKNDKSKDKNESDSDEIKSSSSPATPPKKKLHNSREKQSAVKTPKPGKDETRDRRRSQERKKEELGSSAPVTSLALIVSSGNTVLENMAKREPPVIEREDSGEFYRHLSEGVPRILDHVLTPQRTRRSSPNESAAVALDEGLSNEAAMGNSSSDKAAGSLPAAESNDQEASAKFNSGSSIKPRSSSPIVRTLFDSSDEAQAPRESEAVTINLPEAAEPEDEPWAIYLGIAGPFAIDDEAEPDMIRSTEAIARSLDATPAQLSVPLGPHVTTPLASPTRKASIGRDDLLCPTSVSPRSASPPPSSPRPDVPTPQPSMMNDSQSYGPGQAPLSQPTTAASVVNMAALPPHLHIDPSMDYRKAIARVAAQLHPDLTLSKMTLIVMNKIVNLIFDHIANEAAKFARDNKRNTITSREIQMAVRNMFSQDGATMAQHCIAFASQAVHSHFALQERRKKEEAERIRLAELKPATSADKQDDTVSDQSTNEHAESDTPHLDQSDSAAEVDQASLTTAADESGSTEAGDVETDQQDLDDEVFILRSRIMAERKQARELYGSGQADSSRDAQRQQKRTSGTDKFYEMMSQGAEKNFKSAKPGEGEAEGDISSNDSNSPKQKKRTAKKTAKSKKRGSSSSDSEEEKGKDKARKPKSRRRTASSSSGSERKRRRNKKRNISTSGSDTDDEREKRGHRKRKTGKSTARESSGDSTTSDSEGGRRRAKKDRTKTSKRRTKSSSSSDTDSDRERKRERREKKRKEKEKLGELSTSDSEKERKRREKRRREKEKLRSSSSSDSERERKRILREKRRKELLKLGELSTSSEEEERRRQRREKRRKEKQKLGELSSSSDSERERRRREKRRERRKREMQSSSDTSSESDRDKERAKRKGKDKRDRKKERKHRSSTSSSEEDTPERRPRIKSRKQRRGSLSPGSTVSSSDSDHTPRNKQKKERKKRDKGSNTASSSSSSDAELIEAERRERKERKRRIREKERERDRDRKRDREDKYLDGTTAKDVSSPIVPVRSKDNLANTSASTPAPAKPRKRKGSLTEGQ